MQTPEHRRLTEEREGTAAWKRWGPYLSERAWGTVREDYSADGDAWSSFPFDHARSRTYRWSEDGLAGLSDDQQLLCLSLALWNGRDAILKERAFGLTNPQGNHGEDPKDYWWYLDSTPTHSWMSWAYAYPQCAFPYDDLVRTNGARSRTEPEYELLDTGAFDDDRYWQVELDVAKAGPDDLCLVVRARNAGPEAAELHLLPHLWFRNTWSWGLDDRRPVLRRAADGTVEAEHPGLGRFVLTSSPGATPLFCDNETNTERLWGVPGPAYPKDGIGDHVVHGAPTVNPDGTGTKAALWYRLSAGPGETVEVRLRLARTAADVGAGLDAVMDERAREADAFYASLTPASATADEALVLRQAFGGLLWGKQFFHYDVDRWLVGDPGTMTPPPERLSGRNARWNHVQNADIISMPDKWEYPWYAVWDSAFHCIALAWVDPEFAKDQLLLFLDERYQHPNGQIPAYEWNFADVNPPVHAMAVLKVFELDGRRDTEFLARAFHKLVLNFGWWVNSKDRDGDHLFEGGFLGLDNIGPIDRSAARDGVHLEQSDGTAWMAMFSLNLMKIALRLCAKDRAYDGLARKFFEHFCHIAAGINSDRAIGGLWHEGDGFYYDVLHRPGRESVPLQVRSMVGLVPLFAVEALDEHDVEHVSRFAEQVAQFFASRPDRTTADDHLEVVGRSGERLLSIVGPDRLRAVLRTVLAEHEFLGPYGVRALSRAHLDAPVHIDLGESGTTVLGYEPAESSSPMFGGNSNWRGPVWFPVNHMLVESLLEFHEHLGDGFTVEHPTGSGVQRTLREVAHDVSRRLVATFLLDGAGHRPVWGGTERMQSDPWWRDKIMFFEYFHGDNGAGIGATHQTGWTALVADLIASRQGLHDDGVGEEPGLPVPPEQREPQEPRHRRTPREVAT